jgi:hypothetical protein
VTARELLRISLIDALELRILIARKDPRRHPRVAARWLLRYLEEDPETTIDEAALAASCLAALPGFGRADAAQALRAVVPLRGVVSAIEETQQGAYLVGRRSTWPKYPAGP